MTTIPMIDRLAWIVSDRCNPDRDGAIDKDNAEDVVRAVLQELREPSKGMVERATKLWWLDFVGDEEVKVFISNDQAKEIIQAMIDAAMDGK